MEIHGQNLIENMQICFISCVRVMQMFLDLAQPYGKVTPRSSALAPVFKNPNTGLAVLKSDMPGDCVWQEGSNLSHGL